MNGQPHGTIISHGPLNLSFSPSTVMSSGSNYAEQQLQLATISRSSGSPHYQARAVAARIRSSSNTITITDPNDPTKPAFNVLHRKDGPEFEDGESQRSPHSESRGQEWAALDMGGLGIRNLGCELFAYGFLEKLYLNHNGLTSISSSIAQLKLLSVLDISSNNLTSIPAEIGMLTKLRNLLLFDNQITNLPAELGTLHQLDILGIEGNPLAEPFKGTIMKDGPRALIAHLRDSCPVPLPPPERDWIVINRAESDSDDTFSVLSYNILCERAATPQMYGYTPSWALSWAYRKQLVLQELLLYDADVICLQEVDVENFEEYFSPQLAYHAYKGIFWPKSRAKTMNETERRTVDGCATFYKTASFVLVDKAIIEFSQSALRRDDFKKTQDIFNRVMNKDHIAVVCRLKSKKSGSSLLVANAHIHWDTAFKDVKLVQVALLMEELTIMTKSMEPDTSVIVCGDYNSVQSSGVYDLLSNGEVAFDHPDLAGRVYGKFSEQGMSHNFNLRSAYAHINELQFTNFVPHFCGVLDYIWHSDKLLDVKGVLGDIDKNYLEHVVGFPNAHFPSE